MAYAYLLLIIAFANNLFWLLPNKLPGLGGIHTNDLGILLLASVLSSISLGFAQSGHWLTSLPGTSLFICFWC